MSRIASERDPGLDHRGVIPLEVIGLEKQEDATAGLIADEGLLMGDDARAGSSEVAPMPSCGSLASLK